MNNDKYWFLLFGLGIGIFGTKLLLDRQHKKQLREVSSYVYEKTWTDAHDSVAELLKWGAQNGKHPAELHRILTS